MKTSRLIEILLTVLIAAAILMAWHSASRTGSISPLVLPPIEEVLERLQEGLLSGEWLPHIATTLYEAGLGLCYGVGLAILIGAVFAFVDLLRVSFYPYILIAQTFPKIAIAPLLVTWLGYGAAPKVVISALLAFFPVFVNTISGLRSVKQSEVNLLRSLKASPFQEFIYLRLPRALSYIFPALTVAVVVSLLGAIVGEFVGARKGLGYLIMQYTFLGDVASVYAVLAVLSVIGVSLYGLIKIAEQTTRFKN
ncbi:Riboflavin transport system permease protein RibX [Castellaniella defragrans]